MNTLNSPDFTSTQESVLSLTIKDINALYHAYISFIKNGGLFIPTSKSYSIGDTVFIQLLLLDEAQKTHIASKVVWVTPKGAQNSRAVGIGIQFNDDINGSTVRTKIETYLADMINSEKLTYTM
ncbi:type IV pilus assembly PilZ [Candidatus Nitrosoglobus terrae]|uniref:Type IV pilus assembly PilZ n=1 Tax=Candidatus Nitrosoglobus terrae TaxID=1630141 RepID=A0A1Q2SMN9_9GAMM|nr:PilZ domain-containing protein [Candidatus Nitrosoglobus terrae]BAW80408.1 type IV pilus assembly PilZ [Candidatus Nitrosoglobus terrae]